MSRFESLERELGFIEWSRKYRQYLERSSLEMEDEKSIHKLHNFYNSNRTKISVYYTFIFPFQIFDDIISSFMKIKNTKKVKCSNNNTINLTIEYVLKHFKECKSFDQKSYLKLESNLKYLKKFREMALNPNAKLRSMQPTQVLQVSVKFIQSLNILYDCKWSKTNFDLDNAFVKDAKAFYFESFEENAMRKSRDCDGAYEEPFLFCAEIRNKLYNDTKNKNNKSDHIWKIKVHFLNEHILSLFESSLLYYELLKGHEIQSLIEKLRDTDNVDLNILYNCKKKLFNSAGLQPYLVKKLKQALEMSNEKNDEKNGKFMIDRNSNPKFAS